jgi:threonine/homoserine/homoserine lactone efflux protein
MLDSPIILPSTLASFLLTSFLIEITPGPNMTYLALVSASDGRRAGFATVLGVASGLAVVGAIAAIGVAELIQASTLLYEVLRWAGVLFLLYLAWDGWKTPSTSSANSGVAKGRYFLRGLVYEPA